MRIGDFEKVIVVTGCQRSGTTLTGQVLGAHPKAFLIDEPDGLYRWFDAFASGNPRAEKIWNKVLIAANKKYIPAHSRLIEEPDTARPRCVPGLTHLILKAPNLLYHYDALAAFAGRAAVIYPVRDPRSVVASMTKLHEIPMIEKQIKLLRANRRLRTEIRPIFRRLKDEAVPDHLKRATVWQIKSTLQNHFEARGLPVLSFRYEDFVADPENLLQRIVDHAGLTSDPTMLAHQSIYRGFGPGKTSRTRRIDATSLETWSDTLNAGQVAEVLEMTVGERRQFGYLTETETLPRPVVLDPAANDTAPVILTGRGGSGTRLLSDIGAKTGIFIGNSLNRSGDSLEWLDLMYEIPIHEGRERSGPKPDWPRLIRSTATGILVRSGRRPERPWGWKLPETMLAIPEVFEAFPRAKLVHLVRHPVASSLRRPHMTSRLDYPAGKGAQTDLPSENLLGKAVLTAAYTEAGRDPALMAGDADYIRNALSWRYQVARVMAFGRAHLESDQYLEVRFEDLCADPAREETRISAFLGLERAGETGPPIRIEPSRALGSRKRGSVASDPDTGPDDRAKWVWDHCGDVARSLGYLAPHQA